MLRFSIANAKIQALSAVPALIKFLAGKRKVYSFDLLSGWSCPFAKDCLSKVHETDGKLKLSDGPHTQFRCFSASQEVIYSAAYKMRKHNFDMLRGIKFENMYSTIVDSIPKNLGICRIHVAGDFFNRDYFEAWLNVARLHPDRLFYAYTKSLPYWVANISNIPSNMVLTASKGGRCDNLIGEHNLRQAVVVYHPDEAEKLGYVIDHTDEHAANPDTKNNSFALLIHGIQPAGSDASKATVRLKREKVQFTYSRKA